MTDDIIWVSHFDETCGTTKRDEYWTAALQDSHDLHPFAFTFTPSWRWAAFNFGIYVILRHHREADNGPRYHRDSYDLHTSHVRIYRHLSLRIVVGQHSTPGTASFHNILESKTRRNDIIRYLNTNLSIYTLHIPSWRWGTLSFGTDIPHREASKERQRQRPRCHQDSHNLHIHVYIPSWRWGTPNFRICIQLQRPGKQGQETTVSSAQPYTHSPLPQKHSGAGVGGRSASGLRIRVK
jgi:hypothetical protein